MELAAAAAANGAVVMVTHQAAVLGQQQLGGAALSVQGVERLDPAGGRGVRRATAVPRDA